QPAGVGAMDILDVEAGVLRPERDYVPARGGFDAEPTPRCLGLERLIDPGHMDFIGKLAWLTARESEQCTVVGIEIAAEQPAPNTPLSQGAQIVGHTMASCYSPALRRAIAIAQVESASAAGTVFQLVLAPTREHREFRRVAAQ